MMSLFQMAELRAKHREKKRKEAESEAVLTQVIPLLFEIDSMRPSGYGQG
jgi:predicted NUDIX family phosphoesterase